MALIRVKPLEWQKSEAQASHGRIEYARTPWGRYTVWAQGDEGAWGRIGLPVNRVPGGMEGAKAACQRDVEQIVGELSEPAPIVDVDSIKFAIADYLELRDESMGFISDDNERSQSAIEIHDIVRAILAKIAPPAADDLPHGEWWMVYDSQAGKWCVYDDGPPSVVRPGAEIHHVREVRADQTAVVAGWNACRKSIYAVCEDMAERQFAPEAQPLVGLDDLQKAHARGFYAGGRDAAKSIARGFNSMEALDDDHVRAALAAVTKKDI